jgi:hypothetical protein
MFSILTRSLPAPPPVPYAASRQPRTPDDHIDLALVLCINGFAVDFNRHGIASAGAANQERTIMLLSTSSNREFCNSSGPCSGRQPRGRHHLRHNHDTIVLDRSQAPRAGRPFHSRDAGFMADEAGLQHGARKDGTSLLDELAELSREPAPEGTTDL